MKLHVKLNRCQGRLLTFDSLDCIQYGGLRVLAEGNILLTIEADEPQRTLSQNDLMEWLYSLIGRADHTSPVTVKKHMKDKWGIRFNVNGALKSKSTAKYTIKQAQEYIEHLKTELYDRDISLTLAREVEDWHYEYKEQSHG